MDIISELQTNKDTLATLETEHNAATELLAQAAVEAADLKAQLADKDALIVSANEINASIVEEIATLKAEIESLKANQKSADEKAVELVAKQGVAPMPVNVSAQSAITKEEARKHYQALLTQRKSREAGDFYNANKALFKH